MGLKSRVQKQVNCDQIKALLWKDVLVRWRQPVSVTSTNRSFRLFLFLFETCKFMLKIHFSVLPNVCIQWMTAIQYLYPCLIFVALYLLRLKFQAEDIDFCQYPTRQLPSPTGLLPFFQSYICTIENACSNVSDYHEISEFEAAP